MASANYDTIKQREIHFCGLHPNANQALLALHLLEGLAGITMLQQKSPFSLEITYDLRLITLQVIEEALVELGFHLDNNLIHRLKRALFYYTEETQRANLADYQNHTSLQKVFVKRYEALPHGCRDSRLPHWREYL